MADQEEMALENVDFGKEVAEIMQAFQVLGDRLGYAARQRTTHEGRRDFMKVCGYPEAPGFEDFWMRYLRQGIAARAIDLPVDATWGGGTVEIDGFPGWDELESRLKITARLTEVDRLAGIGEFACLLIGVKEPDGNDNKDFKKMLQQPVERLSGGLNDILYLRQFARDKVEIEKVEENPGSSRFGLPTLYKIDFDPSYRSVKKKTFASTLRQEKLVHWTRIVHVTSNAMLNEVEGIPRLLKTIDNLINLDKIIGGGAEMWWQGADRSLHLNATGKLTTQQKESFRTQLEEIRHGLDRLLLTSNAELSTLSSVQPDPGPFAEVLFSLIAADMGQPKRILFGSERGELASTQDRNNFADGIANRRTTYAKPSILDKLLERFHLWGVGPAVAELTPIFPPIEILSVTEVTENRLKDMQAIKTAEDAASLGNVADIEELRDRLGFEKRAQIVGINETPGVDEDLDENDPEIQAQFEASKALAA